MLRLFFGFMLTPQVKFFLEKQPDWRIGQLDENHLIETKHGGKTYIGRYFSENVPYDQIEKEKDVVETSLSRFPEFPQKNLHFYLFYQTFIG